MANRLVSPAVRRIGAAEAEAWRAVRLRALEDAPEAFGSTYDETVDRPPEYWVERASASANGDESALYLADGGDGLAGLAGGFVDESGRRYLISMWVEPASRGSRVADRLVDRVVDWASLAGVSELRLWVTATNERARRFYERLGFAANGERQALPSNPALDEIEMARDLDGHIAVRRIRPDEAEAWRATRLAALRDAPEAFGPTYEDTLEQPVSRWTDRVEEAATGDRLAVFAAVDGERWVGLAGVDAAAEAAGTVHLGSIWIAPEVRGRGVLPRLLDAVRDWAVASGWRRIILDVTETNERAIRSYERSGYALTGEQQPLRAGSDLDEVRMAMELYEQEDE